MRLRWTGATRSVPGVGMLTRGQAFDIDDVQGKQLVASGRAAVVTETDAAGATDTADTGTDWPSRSWKTAVRED